MKRKQPRKVFMFKKGNMEAVRNDLKKYFEEYIATEAPFRSVNENYQFFKTSINDSIRNHVAQKNISGR